MPPLALLINGILDFYPAESLNLPSMRFSEEIYSTMPPRFLHGIRPSFLFFVTSVFLGLLFDRLSGANLNHRLVPPHDVARYSTSILPPKLSLWGQVLCVRDWNKFRRVLYEATMQFRWLFRWQFGACELRSGLLREIS